MFWISLIFLIVERTSLVMKLASELGVNFRGREIEINLDCHVGWIKCDCLGICPVFRIRLSIVVIYQNNIFSSICV